MPNTFCFDDDIFEITVISEKPLKICFEEYYIYIRNHLSGFYHSKDNRVDVLRAITIT